ncbi:putative alpha-glucosidase [Aspergillus candidus]|uniref:Probable alpha/beta-glucosidase agdC n=1 Tax=Aspergillus candidus TaxID=41067 RepID=A0A2I2EZ36_ASPCN|nr:putative alpha-glucosidase [Aspergillus candidus]PLB33629.1 putative alpha-glucosidase [Aspergillus candidus]
MRVSMLLLAPLAAGAAVLGSRSKDQSDCPGYYLSNIHEKHNSLTADLTLAGKPCDTYGKDLKDLKLLVEYQSDERLHVMIYDADEQVYQVPESVVPRIEGVDSTRQDSELKFHYEENPFSFTVTRGQEILFDTSDSTLIFQSQYLNLRTSLPKNPNLYGLGEHIGPLRLPTTNYSQTFWNRDAYGTPEGTNLYGTHPVYYDHRGEAGTHGVFLLNSNGMDVKIDQTEDGKQYLEYNSLGGVFDFYFFTGDTPKEASIQYSEIVGLPAMQSYWAFGYHNCRYGYRDIFEVAEVVYNYSKAEIPLETMWTDIDYMSGRRVFTLDDERYALDNVRSVVDYLHDHDQKYIVMVDPAVSVSDNVGYKRGVEQDIFLKNSTGDLFLGAVWPGVTAFPDWFKEGTQEYWNEQFGDFFSAEDGVDIDGLWIDMNEGANFCPFPCSDPFAYAEEADLPPAPPPVRPSNPRPLPGFPKDFQPSSKVRRDSTKGNKLGLPGRDLLNPAYKIDNVAGVLSNLTIHTDIIHEGEEYSEYDTHNLYGAMMSSASREAMESRRPGRRPLIITRSTFAGAGKDVGHWLGDNLSEWWQYRRSIAQITAFASMFQVPMVGADVCGFGANTTEELCSRWAALGAFYSFYRNHNGLDSIAQEFYRWPKVAESARKAIDIRYRLLDYIYTSFYRQSQTGEPFLQPFFYLYPEDKNTFSNDLQFFYGDALLVSPVPDEGATSVEAYFPKDIFYDWYTGAPVVGQGANITLEDIDITHIPLHIRGGSIIPVRSSSAMTTTELRKKNFELIIAPGLDGKASGSLYLDDGDSLEQEATLEVEFTYEKGTLHVKGKFEGDIKAVVDDIKVYGAHKHTGVKTASVKQRLELTKDTEVKVL